MSKLSFRARALDPAKPMPIYLAEELPDLPEYSAINRAVPQMPSGMEKEEESEHHLQRAICTGLIIPTPEVFTCDQDFYDRSYPPNYKMPRQMIHMQPLGLEQDIPDYDMDSADEMWVNQQSRRLELTPLKFEQMMDRLEKSSGQTVVTLNEAKALLKQDDEVSIAVYDYWLNKRLKTQHPLILSVKTENRPGTSANNPYLAFRRRTEKMQTRKNRKNDETSYEKMLKLRRDLCRATTVLEMVKRREKTKREQLHLSIEIFEKRVQLRDFSGSLMSELSSTIKNSRPAFAPLYTNQYSHNPSTASTNPVGGLLPSSTASTSGGHSYTSTSQYLNAANLAVEPVGNSSSGSRKEKRPYKKRKHKIPREKQYSIVQSSSPAPIESTIETEEEDLTNNPLGSEGEDEGQFAFRRNKNCNYHRPLDSYGNWPWESKNDNGYGDKKYRYTLTSIRHPRPRCIGFARRRMGRGGRVILDRASTNMDDIWSKLDYTIMESCSSQNPAAYQNNANSTTTTSTTANNQQTQNSARTCPTNENVNNTIDCDYADDDYDDDDENISRDSLYVTAFVKPVPIKRPKRKWDYNSFHPKHRTSFNNNNNNNSENNNSISNITRSLLSDDLIKHEKLNDVEDNFKFSSSSFAANVDQSQQQQQQQQATTSSIYSEVVSDIVKKAPVLPTDRKFNPNEISNSSSSSSFKFSCNSLNEQTYNSINRTTSNVNNYINNNNNNNNDGKPNVISNAADVQIKQEVNDSADLNILDDENVNLARLSSYINANRNNNSNALNTNNQTSSTASDMLIKAEPDDEMSGGVTINNNQLPKSQFTEAKDVLRRSSSLKACFGGVDNDRIDRFPFLLDCTSATPPPPPLASSSSPSAASTSKQIELDHEILSEIRRDWLHFRPKTPSKEFDDFEKDETSAAVDAVAATTTATAIPAASDNGETAATETQPTKPAVGFSAMTPIAIEMQRLSRCASPPSSALYQDSGGNSTSMGLWDSNSDNALFVTNPFTYADLEPDSELLPSAIAANYLSKCSASSNENNLDGDGTNVGIDLNLSGDSLADMNFSLGEDDNENMLDNILQECQIDDIKTLNQTTTFWNGILDDGGAGLLDCIEEKKLSNDVTTKHGEAGDSAGADASLEDDKDDVKAAINNKFNHNNFNFGSSRFSTINGLKDEIFFKKEEVKEKLPEVNKIEPPDEILASPPPPPPVVSSTASSLPASSSTSSSASSSSSSTATVAALSIAQPPAHQQLQIMQQQGLVPTSEFTANATLVQHQSAAGVGQRTALRVVQQQQQQQLQQQQQQQHLLQQHNLQLQQKNLVTPGVTQSAIVTRPHVLTSMATTNHTTIFATQDSSNANGGSGSSGGGSVSGGGAANMPQKIYLKQSNCNVGGVVSTNQVPNNVNQQQQNAVILANVKLENEITCDSLGNTIITSNGPNHSGNGGGNGGGGGGSGLVDAGGGGGSSSGNGNLILTENLMTHQTPMIVTTSKAQQQQQQQQQQQTQQIVWRHVGQGGSGFLSTDATANKIVWASRAAGQKKQLNGPEMLDKLIFSRKLSQRKVQIAHQQQQQQQQQQPQQQYQVIKNEDDSSNTSIIDVNNQQTTQKTLPAGKVIKMSSYPVVVSELSVQQQQNSAAVAANHNYSLQPSSQPITMISQQQQQQNSGGTGVAVSSGNKLILSTAAVSAGNVTSGTNFTIATTSSGDLQNKVHYKEIPNTNLKLNFVSTGSLQQGNIVVDAKNAQQVNNQQLKTTQQQQQQLQQQQQIQLQKMKRDRILNIIGSETPDNKRVFYTSLLNLKSLHKNNSGQMQMQISPGMTTVLGKQQLQRIANNPALFANMRVPITNQVVNSQTGASVSVAGTTTAMYTTSASPKTSSNEISVKINNNSNEMATTSSNMNAGTSSTGNTTTNNNNNNSLSAGINLNTTNR